MKRIYPIAEVSSSVDPKASNMMSSLDLRSPVYVEEVPSKTNCSTD